MMSEDAARRLTERLVNERALMAVTVGYAETAEAWRALGYAGFDSWLEAVDHRARRIAETMTPEQVRARRASLPGADDPNPPAARARTA